MNAQAIDRRNRLAITRLMPMPDYPQPKSTNRALTIQASVIFIFGATLLVWTTRHDLLETFAAYYLLGMSTLYVVTREKCGR